MSRISTSKTRPGAVILVAVPFTDLSQTKNRPAVVLLSRGDDHLVAFLTSRLQQAGTGDVIIKATRGNGLAADSAVMVTKMFTLHESLIVRTLGQLDSPDHRAVVERLVTLLQKSIGAA